MKLVVLDDWQAVAPDCADWGRLRGVEVVFHRVACGGEAALVAALEGADIVLPMRERSWLTAPVLRALPRLKLIALTGRSTRHVDVETCRAQGITLCWSGTYHPEETAEFTFGLILAAERGIAAGDAAMRAGGFQAGTGLGRRLAGLTLGVVGLGSIGARVARLGVAFGMQVLACSRSLTAEGARAVGARVASLDGLLAGSDIVSLHVPLTEASRSMIGGRELARMRPGALLVNTARGALVDGAALLAALHSGHLRAALDVYDTEPLPGDHPLRQSPGTLLTPHLGFATTACFADFYRSSLENIEAWLAGQPIRVL